MHYISGCLCDVFFHQQSRFVSVSSRHRSTSVMTAGCRCCSSFTLAVALMHRRRPNCRSSYPLVHNSIFTAVAYIRILPEAPSSVILSTHRYDCCSIELTDHEGQFDDIQMNYVLWNHACSIFIIGNSVRVVEKYQQV